MNIHSKLSIVFAILALTASTGCAAPTEDGQEPASSEPAIVLHRGSAAATPDVTEHAAREDDMPLEMNGPIPTPGDPLARDLPHDILPPHPCPGALPELATPLSR